MKKIIQAFARKRYTSDKDGNIQLEQMDASLMQAIGAATDIRWEVTVWARSSANARGELNVFEGTKMDPRPTANKFSGTPVTGSPLTISNLYMTRLQVAGPFDGLIDATFGCKSTTPTNDVMEWIDASVAVTCDYR